jgi:hypothetical protein
MEILKIKKKTCLFVATTISRNEEHMNARELEEMQIVINFLPALVVQIQTIFPPRLGNVDVGRMKRDGNVGGIHVRHIAPVRNGCEKPQKSSYTHANCKDHHCANSAIGFESAHDFSSSRWMEY